MRRLVELGLGLGVWLGGCGASVPSPRPAEKAAVSAPAAFKSGLVFGSADPYTLLGFDPAAQWVVLCQARADTDGDGITRVGFRHHGERSGDEMKTYFVLGGGQGEVVDGYLGSDASGTWVALRKGQSVYLLNTRTGEQRDLGTVPLDKEADPSAAGGIRNLRFAPKKAEVLLVEAPKGGRATVMVMDLTSGAVHRLELGLGRVWQAGFSSDGSWVQASVVTRDLNKNGKLDLPTIETNLSGDVCGQPSSYSTFGLDKDHDELTQVAVPAAGGKLRLVPNAQGSIDGDLIWTRPDGALVKESSSGKQQVLASPACAGAVLDYYSLAHKRWLVACRVATEHQAGGAREAERDPAGERPTELWVFGEGLPEAGQAVGISLEYGAEAGAFGSERYSRLQTEGGTLLYDLKELKIVPIPQGYEPCARHDDSYLLQPVTGRNDADPAAAPSSMAALWSPGGAPAPVADAWDCSTLGDDRHVLLDNFVFDWAAKKVVGTVQALCRGENCRALSYAPFSPSQHFLWKQPVAAVSETVSLQSKLRESLVDDSVVSYAQRGPLSFQSWSPLTGASALSAKSTTLDQAPDWLREPPLSCEPLTADVRGNPSALPPWTERRPVPGTIARFPAPHGTRDDLPTYEHLQEQICTAPGLAFVLDDMEQVAAAYSKASKPAPFLDLEVAPALSQLQDLLRQCSPADTCRHAVALADSRYDNVKAALAPELLLACDAKAAGNRFVATHAEPLLQLEWLVAGQGRKTSGVATLKPLLEQILASKNDDTMERAVALLASDSRAEVAALLLETRARLARAPAPVEEHVPNLRPMPFGPQATKPFGIDELDLALGSASQPRLKQLYREACSRLATVDADDSIVKFSCRAAEPGAKPVKLEYRFLEPRPPAEKVEVTTLSRLLEDAERPQCAKAVGGKCPDLPTVKLSRDWGGAWNALYRAVVELTRVPGSPIAGALLDTPLRRRNGKLDASWRLWLDGRVYEMGPDEVTRASLAWARERSSEPKSEMLAMRGALAWLNGIASARGVEQRFFFAKRGIHGFIVLATPAQACALSSAKLVNFSQEPMMFNARRQL